MKTAICAIIKNEHKFLKEWIDWHLGLGFDAIHLFEDKGSNSHEEICKNYNNVFLRRYENDNEVQELLEAQGSSHIQFVLYTWFANNYKGIYDRVAFIDLDEFINFSTDYSLGRLCIEFEPYPAVLLNWRMMGASGRISRPSCGVIEAYNQECDFCNTDRLWAFKSFVNLNRFEGFIDLHRAVNFVNTHHSTNHLEYHYDKAWINHYFTKSLEDWIDRIFHKGGTQNGHRKLSHFFECNKNMKYLESLCINKYIENIPNGTYKLKNNSKIITGGNIQKIKLLNCNIPFQNNLTDKERLEVAIKTSGKYGFKDNGKRDNLIHIFWLGKNKFPSIIEKCIESWKIYLNDYTVCFWNEDSADLSHPWVKLSYESKSWAFTVDYLRLWAIYTFGGIYLDTDVEFIKKPESLPKNFVAIENGFNSIAFGLCFGAEKGNEVVRDMMSMYDNFYYTRETKESFIQPYLTFEYFKSRGYVFKEGIRNFLGFTIYPPEYFCPKNFYTKDINITKNTLSIHHYTATWHK